MGQNDVEVIDLLSVTPPSCGRTKKKLLVDGDSEIKHILCLKNAADLQRFEETEDCFIIDFAPIDLSKLFDAHHDDEGAPEIAVVYEKGPVACRDYPHSRHLCLKFPFATAAHSSHCKMCYCYVCDTPAPCVLWVGTAKHCDACVGGGWETLRSDTRKLREAAPLK